MRFYVIYSFDIRRDQSVKPLQPPNVKNWEYTEGDDQYEFDYLEGEYVGGKHRKYCAELSKEQFKRFIDHCCLHMDDVETMGSLTVEYGHIPAFSFTNDDPEVVWQSAYVTPFPEHPIKGQHFSDETLNEKNWNRIKQALLNLHGTNPSYYSQTYRNYHFGG